VFAGTEMRFSGRNLTETFLAKIDTNVFPSCFVAHWLLKGIRYYTLATLLRATSGCGNQDRILPICEATAYITCPADHGITEIWSARHRQLKLLESLARWVVGILASIIERL
jgi:hypothetical protein